MSNAAEPADPTETRSLAADLFWDDDRHKFIASAAQELLADHAKQKVLNLLSQVNASSMRSQAVWLDTMRGATLHASQDSETKSFLQNPANLNNGYWHFVNLPLGIDGYDRERYPQFTASEDVVQITMQCIKVLQGNSNRFSPVNALRILIHLVEDLHQPLHCGCAFIRKSGNTFSIETDPGVITAANLKHDRGGNYLFLPGDIKLHSYWDGALTGGGGNFALAESDDDAESTQKRELLAKEFASSLAIQSPNVFAESDVLSLPITWVNESVAAARVAYQNIHITGRRNSTDFDISWDGRDAYNSRCEPIVNERMKSAATNLAVLLNNIFF